jgi:hypothetical protein
MPGSSSRSSPSSAVTLAKRLVKPTVRISVK